ncbi:MAG: hypothetical protein AAF098_01005 [Pseudomonadota bacterium]
MSQLELGTAISQSAVVAASRLYYLALRGMFLFLFVSFLGVGNYGIFNYAQSWYLLLMPLALLGTNELIISQFPLASSNDRKKFLATSLALRLLSSSFTSLLVILFALSLETDGLLQRLMMIFAPAALIRGCIGWFSSVFVAQSLVLRWTTFSTFFVTLEVVAVLFAASSGANLVELALLQILLWVAKLLACWYYAARQKLLTGFDWVCVVRWDKTMAQRLALDGLPLAIGNFLLLSLAVGLLIPYRLATPDLTSLGVAAVVLQVFMLAQEPLTRTFNALLPALRYRENAFRSRESPMQTHLGMFAIFTGCCLAIVARELSLYLAGTDQLLQFHPALLLVSQYSWLLVPIMTFHALRPLVIVDGRYLIYLMSILVGFVSALGVLVAYRFQGPLTPEHLLLALGTGFTVLSLMTLSNLLLQSDDWFQASSRLVLLIGVLALALVYPSYFENSPSYLRSLSFLLVMIGSVFFFFRLKKTYVH